MSNAPEHRSEPSSFNTKIGVGCIALAIFPGVVFICTLAVLMALRIFGVI